MRLAASRRFNRGYTGGRQGYNRGRTRVISLSKPCDFRGKEQGTPGETKPSLWLAPPREEQHDSAEGEEDQATPEVDVDPQRLLVHGGVRTRRQAVDSQDDA